MLTRAVDHAFDYGLDMNHSHSHTFTPLPARSLKNLTRARMKRETERTYGTAQLFTRSLIPTQTHTFPPRCTHACAYPLTRQIPHQVIRVCIATGGWLCPTKLHARCAHTGTHPLTEQPHPRFHPNSRVDIHPQPAPPLAPSELYLTLSSSLPLAGASACPRDAPANRTTP